MNRKAYKRMIIILDLFWILVSMLFVLLICIYVNPELNVYESEVYGCYRSMGAYPVYVAVEEYAGERPDTLYAIYGYYKSPSYVVTGVFITSAVLCTLIPAIFIE